jgi:hypothetical protein
MGFKTFIVIVFIGGALANLPLRAQNLVEGYVLDQVSNQALAQVHVVNISHRTEVVSNAKGEFKIAASVNDLLVFRTFGYVSDTVLVTNFKPLKHYLKTDVNNLNTVSVTGTRNYKKQYAQTINKANAVLLTPGRGLLFYPSSYFSRAGRQARYFKRMIKKEQTELMIDQKFNRKTVAELLPLKQPELDAFIMLYRPSLAFVKRADQSDFKFYLINAYNQFKLLPPEKRKVVALKSQENP